MPKLVEYPAPVREISSFEEAWRECGCFPWYLFSESELEVSGYDGFFYEDLDLQFALEPMLEAYENWEDYWSPLQVLVYRAFDNGVAGAIRELWLRDAEWDPELRDAILVRFPIETAVEVRKLLAAVDVDGTDFFERYVQCVAMLHAYTGMPSGEKSPEERRTDEAALAGGAAGQLISRIRNAAR